MKACLAACVGCALSVGLLSLLALLSPTGCAKEPEDLSKKPITGMGGPVGDLLRGWWKEGTAAGNVGDLYDNRDGDHSPLNITPYPQLGQVTYSAEDKKQNKHWAAARVVRKGIVFGNSSTSAPPTLGGSNPRMYYSVRPGLDFLYQQYRNNNLYIYPEHRDHDPGHNGRNDGFGDLYPTNTPYLIISQGSSGSDQPFMRALPFTLAAFRPEVKKKLAERGLLMPTIQMILRSTNKHLQGPEDYLTGKAHPTVFEGSWVDELAMVQKAHAFKVDALPPLVQLDVIEDEQPKNGVDFFELPGTTETLADTPCVVARIYRGKEGKRRIALSTQGSIDINDRPLTFTWVVLRGDAGRVTIEPKNKAKSLVEITVPYPERRPVTPGSSLESNRLDIGVFAHNGTYYSAPAFVTFFSLDREGRTYDESGKILEIAHQLGETTFTVTDWPELVAELGRDSELARFLKPTAAQKEALGQAAAKLPELAQSLKRARDEEAAADKRANETQAESKKAEAQIKEQEKLLQEKKVSKQEYDARWQEAGVLAASAERARKQLGAVRAVREKTQKAHDEFLASRRDALGGSVGDYVERALRGLVNDPDFQAQQWPLIRDAKDGPMRERLKRLQEWGIADRKGNLTLLRKGAPTDFEKAELEYAHAATLVERASGKRPGPLVRVEYHVNFTDPRLSVPRAWRDLYGYDAKGACTGWTRLGPDGRRSFDAAGKILVDGEPRRVRYAMQPNPGGGPPLLRDMP